MDFKNIALENQILEIRVGSHLFGTDTEDSDLDLFGIFMPCDEIVYGSQRCEEVKFDKVSKDSSGRNTKDAIDHSIHEYRKFIKLALQNNPNILHTLFVDEKNIRYIDEYGKRLLEKAELFPHKGSFDRFIKYAHSQKHKMIIRVEHYRDLQKGYEILKNEDSHKVMSDFKEVSPFNYKGNGKHLKCGDVSLELGTFVKKARRILKERIESATNRTELFERHGFDTKFGSNLIHLLMEGIELMNTGRIEYPLSYRQDILDIKKGKYTLPEIIEWSDELELEARKAYESTSLRSEPLTKEIEQFSMNEVKKWMNR